MHAIRVYASRSVVRKHRYGFNLNWNHVSKETPDSKGYGFAASNSLLSGFPRAAM